MDAYLTLSKRDRSSLEVAATPFLDEDKAAEDCAKDPEGTVGALQPIASSVLMKVLYAARLSRFDLLKAVANLAQKVTKWDKGCDRMLHRLMCYINSSLDLRLKGHIGDSPKDLVISLYSDADFAGDKESSKSTSGIFIALTGPNSFYPLNAISKKQTCVSHSTPEAEIVAANAAVRTEGLPALGLWQLVLGRKIDLILLEDNTATMQVLKSGKNPTMRHLNRTHRVNFAWLSEVFRKCDQVHIAYCNTNEQAADLLTKGFTNPLLWERVRSLIGVTPLKDKSNSYGTNSIEGQVDPGTLLHNVEGKATVKQLAQAKKKAAEATS